MKSCWNTSSLWISSVKVEKKEESRYLQQSNNQLSKVPTGFSSQLLLQIFLKSWNWTEKHFVNRKYAVVEVPSLKPGQTCRLCSSRCWKALLMCWSCSLDRVLKISMSPSSSVPRPYTDTKQRCQASSGYHKLVLRGWRPTAMASWRRWASKCSGSIIKSSSRSSKSPDKAFFRDAIRSWNDTESYELAGPSGSFTHELSQRRLTLLMPEMSPATHN